MNLTAASIDLVEQLTPATTDVFAWQSAASLALYNPADLQSLNLGDDQVSQRIPLGFSFLYFGETYEGVEVSSNGFVSFGNLGGNSLCCDGAPLDGMRAPPTIFGLWTDLNPQSLSNPKAATIVLPNGQREFVVQWSAVPEFGTNEINTFEIRIRENGEVLLNFGGVSIIRHSVSAGLTGRTVNDTSPLFYRNFANNFQSSSNVVSDISQTSSIFRQPSATSQISNQAITSILNGGSNLAINTKDFTTANSANASIGNFKLTTSSVLNFPTNGPVRQIAVSADKDIRIEGDQIFSCPVEIRLVADANLDDLGGTVSTGNILGANLIDITGDLTLSGLREIRALGDVVVRGDIITSPDGSGSAIMLDAQNNLVVTGVIGNASLASATLRAGNLNLNSVHAGQVNVALADTGVISGPVIASALSLNRSGFLTLTGSNPALGQLRVLEGFVRAPDVASIGSGEITLGQNAVLEFTGLNPVTLLNAVNIMNSAAISFRGSGTIAGPINAASGAAVDFFAKAGSDLTFAGEIGTGRILRSISASAEGRMTLGQSARLLATNRISLLGGQGFTNLSSLTNVIQGGQGWTIWSGNSNPFGGNAPDITGSLQHDWRSYSITAGQMRGMEPLPSLPSGNGLAYSFAPMLTPQVVGDLSKLYDGTRNFSAGQVSVNFDGLINGDTLNSVNISSILADVAGVSATQATISGVNANFTDRSGKAVFGYQFSPTLTAPASILPRPLLATLVGAVSRNYDGTTDALLSSGNFAVDGLVLGETMTVTQTAGAFATANVGSNLPVSASLASTNFAAGAGTALSNYLLPTTATGAIGSILPLTLIYRAAPAVRFLGAPNPSFTGSVTGFLEGETLATATTGTLVFTTPATMQSGVGSYPITGDGLSASNYTFMQAAENTRALTIQPNIVNQVSSVIVPSQGSGTGLSSGSGSSPSSGSTPPASPASGTGPDSGSGSGPNGSANSDPASNSDGASPASDGSGSSDAGPAPGSSEGSTSSGSTGPDPGGSQAPETGGDSASTDQQSSSPSTVITLEVDAADPLPPSPVGDEPTPTPSDPEDSSDPVLAAVSGEDDTQVRTTNTQQQIVALSSLISVSPSQTSRPAAGTQDDALSINVSLMP